MSDVVCEKVCWSICGIYYTVCCCVLSYRLFMSSERRAGSLYNLLNSVWDVGLSSQRRGRDLQARKSESCVEVIIFQSTRDDVCWVGDFMWGRTNSGLLGKNESSMRLKEEEVSTENSGDDACYARIRTSSHFHSFNNDYLHICARIWCLHVYVCVFVSPYPRQMWCFASSCSSLHTHLLIIYNSDVI